MYKTKKISNKLILNLSIPAPFLVGNQPEVSYTSVGRFLLEKASFTLQKYITIKILLKSKILFFQLYTWQIGEHGK